MSQTVTPPPPPPQNPQPVQPTPTRLPSSIRNAGNAVRAALVHAGQPVPEFPAQTQLPNIGIAPTPYAAQTGMNQSAFPTPTSQPHQAVTYNTPAEPAPPPLQVNPNAPFDAPGTVGPTMDPNVSALMQQNQQLIRMLAERAQTPGLQPATPQGVQLAIPQLAEVDEATRATYAKADPYIRQVAAELMREAAKPLVEELNTLRTLTTEQNKQLQDRVAGTSRQMFDQQFAEAVPDMAQLQVTPAFQAFLNEPVQNAPHLRIRDIMSRAHQAGDLRTIRANTDLFRQRYGQAQPVPVGAQPFMQPTPSLPGYVPPQMQNNQQQGQMLTASQRETDFAAYRAGRMPQDEWFNRQAAYDNAVIAGRFDYTK